MKIYMLRHEDRTQDCSFFSPLTMLGLEKADQLIQYLNKCNIDEIYSSPFIRTLQTIKPYVNKYKRKINIEYGLSEIHNEDIIPKKAVGIMLPDYIADQYNYNCEYKSIIKHTKIKYPEKYSDVVKRIKIILYNLIKKYHNNNINILIVTHQSLCCAILEIIKQSNKSIILEQHMIQNYPKGKLSLIFNNDWCFESITP